MGNYLETIIYPSKLAFITNWFIQDNVIVNHEIMLYLNRKKGKKGYMAVKVDLAKAYDRVEWGVLPQVLQLFGFSKKFTDLITTCISSAKYSILLNGSPYGYFTASKGIR